MRFSAIGVMLLAILVYLPAMGHGYAMDDVGDVLENSVVQDSSDPLEVVTQPYRDRVPPERSPWRPLTSLSHWVMVQFGSTSDLHITNIVAHALSTGLVFALLVQMGLGGWAPVAGSAVFAVHPVHVEAVAGIVGGADVLMTLFCLLGVLAFVRLEETPVVRTVAVSACYAMALLAKENGVALPALLAATVYFDRRPWRRRDTTLMAALLGVLVLYLGARTAVLGTLVHNDTAPYIAVLDPTTRFTTAVANLLHLLRLMVVPVDLIADYGPAVITPTGAASPRFWAGLLVGAGTALGVALFRRRHPPTALALTWIVLSVFVVSNLVLPIGVWVAERTLYLPSVGVALLAGILWDAGAHLPRARRAAAAGFLALVVAAGARTFTRGLTWMDTETVLRTLAEEHPESYRSQWYVARTLTDRGDLERGILWFDRAIETNPVELRLRLDHVRAVLMAGRAGEGEALAENLPGTDPSRWVYWGQSLIMQSMPDSAEAVVERGLELFPDDARLLRQARELAAAPVGPDEPGG